MEEKDTQKRGKRKMTKGRNIKTENTFSVFQKEKTEPLRKEEEPPQERNYSAVFRKREHRR